MGDDVAQFFWKSLFYPLVVQTLTQTLLVYFFSSPLYLLILPSACNILERYNREHLNLVTGLLPVISYVMVYRIHLWHTKMVWMGLSDN